MLTVQNSLKDRSKTIRKVPDSDLFEWGWEVVNRRKKANGYFNRVGVGTYDEASEWMDKPDIPERKRLRVYQNFVSH